MLAQAKRLMAEGPRNVVDSITGVETAIEHGNSGFAFRHEGAV
jgi:hypothetical protein